MKRLLVLLILPLLLVAGIVGANVLVGSFTATVTVDEALVLVAPIGNVPLSLFPGESETIEIDVQNLASVPLNAMVTAVESSNPNLVDYSISYDFNPLGIPATSISTITATISVAEDSPTGVVELAFNAERTS